MRKSEPLVYIFIIVALIFFTSLFIPNLYASKEDSKNAAIKRGKLLTEQFGCVYCHSPKKEMNGELVIDEERIFSGHPEGKVMPDITPELVGPGKWMGLYTMGMTAWGGPWGITYSANLTPDKETGIGNLSKTEFISLIRLGIHSSMTRTIQPPMPWSEISRLHEDELGAIYIYLNSIKPVKNKVPESRPMFNHPDLAN